MLATDDGCANDSVLVWDPRSGQQTAVLSGQTRLGADDLAFSRDSKTLFAGSSVGGVDRWDIGAATVTATFAEPGTG
jgi:WD40 repeat protein